MHLKDEGEEDLGCQEGVVASFVRSFTDGVAPVSWVQTYAEVSNEGHFGGRPSFFPLWEVGMEGERILREKF